MTPRELANEHSRKHNARTTDGDSDAPKKIRELQERIKQLEGALGRKTLENEILKEAVEYGKARKWIARSPLLPGDEQ